jgi:hypothetical protein
MDSAGITAAVVTLLAAIVAALNAWRAAKKVDVIDRKTDVIHHMANDRLTQALEKIERLERWLLKDSDTKDLDAARAGATESNQVDDQPNGGET